MRESGLIKISLLIATLLLFLFSCGGEEERTPLLPLRIITNKLPDATYGREYYFTLSGSGGVQPYRWEILGELPKGIMFDGANGIFSGTVKEDARSSSIEVELYDSLKKENPVPVTERYVIKIISRSFVASEEVEVLTKKLPMAENKSPYEVYLSATGGLPPYQWSQEGELPKDIRFDGSKGLLEGVPQETGNWRLIFSVKDVMGKTALEKTTLELVVREKALVRGESFPPFEILTKKIPPGVVGRKYIAYLSATGGAPPYHWKAESKLPDGVSLNSETGEIFGIPQKSGNYEFRFSAKDERSPASSSVTVLSFEVMPPPVNRIYPLKIITKAIPKAIKGKYYSFALSAQGGMLPYRWTCLTPLPSDFKLDKNTGVLEGISQITGPYILKIELADSSNPPSAVWRKLNLVIEEAKEDGGFSFSAMIVILIAIGFIITLIGWITTLRRKREIAEISKLEILTRELPPACAGERYFTVFIARGGVAPYLWDNENPLPTDFMIDGKKGVLYGTPKHDLAGEHEIDIILYDSDSPSNKVYHRFTLKITSGVKTAEKKVFTIVAKEDKILFEEFPPDSRKKKLVSGDEIGTKTSTFLKALRKAKEENIKGTGRWVVYCHTEYPSGVDIAFKAGEIAKDLGLSFYTILKRAETP